jgi:hypothetical protein
MDEKQTPEAELTDEQLAGVYGGAEEQVEACTEDAPAEFEAVVM